MVMVIDAVALCAGTSESVTLNVSEVPDAAALGVPLTMPVAGSSDSPAGKVPLASDQV
jgi:hypothetical protein